MHSIITRRGVLVECTKVVGDRTKTVFLPTRVIHGFVPSTDFLCDNRDFFFSFLKQEETCSERSSFALSGKATIAREIPRTQGNQSEDMSVFFAPAPSGHEVDKNTGTNNELLKGCTI